MTQEKELARQALRGALEVRRKAGVSKSEPVCVYDLAERLKIEVRFLDGNSFGGVYAKAAQTILVPALRPPGRRAFTCAHEIGHWHFGHGTRVDELGSVERRSDDPEEQLANMFAGYLLMPNWAVEQVFARRNWNPAFCTPLQIYMAAVQLGVGYATLIQHLRFSLHLISDSRTDFLMKTTPKQLRCSIFGNNATPHLVVADSAWIKVPIDLEIGDKAILPRSCTLEGSGLDVLGDHELGLVIEARAPGISRAACAESWASFVRVSRRNFVGRSVYRYLEDPDVDEEPCIDH